MYTSKILSLRCDFSDRSLALKDPAELVKSRSPLFIPQDVKERHAVLRRMTN
jgi:hypothetical protein